MKAIVQRRYGKTDVLRLEEIDRPTPADDEVLVRVRASSVHADVWHVMTGQPYVLRLMGAGLTKPKHPVPGTDLAGIVESVGKSVSRFAPGDEVFGETLRGMQWVNGGAYAEYATAPEFALEHKPANVTFEQAAAVPTAALIALYNLRTEGQIRAGQQILINGAGGGVGTIALQLAKAFGATVTCVDCAEKLETLRQLGADRVVDYAQVDFTRAEERYDLIFDIPGNHSFSECKRALSPEGVYVLIGHDNYGQGMHRWFGQIPRMLRLMVLSLFTKQLPRISTSMPDKKEPMALLKQLLETGKLTPHIDRTYPLAEVPRAIGYLQSGKAIGKIVVLAAISLCLTLTVDAAAEPNIPATSWAFGSRWEGELVPLGLATGLFSASLLVHQKHSNWGPDAARNAESKADNYSYATVGVATAFGLTSYVLKSELFRQAGLSTPSAYQYALPLLLSDVEAVVVASSVTDIIKKQVGRCRPRSWRNGKCDATDDEEFKAFPSGHTTIPSALAGVHLVEAWREPHRLSNWLIFGGIEGAAIATGVLRVRAGAHSWSDVAAGFALGHATGVLVALAHPRAELSRNSNGFGFGNPTFGFDGRVLRLGAAF